MPLHRPVVHHGSKKTIVFAVCRDGTSPAEEFFDALNDGEKAKLLKTCEKLGAHGKVTNKTRFKPIEGTEFFEFKSHQIRMPCYLLPGQLVVITHGFTKKSDKIPVAHIERARRIKAEDLAVAQEKDPARRRK